MIKILLTVAALGSVGSFAGLAMAQGKQGEAFGSDISSLLAKLEAQCAHRRIMPPDPRDDCVSKLNKLRGEAHLGSGSATVTGAQAAGVGPGKGGGPGNGIGPGSGGGQAKGRR
jgi:hypothetical protein